jgi:hypothetical protein
LADVTMPARRGAAELSLRAVASPVLSSKPWLVTVKSYGEQV